MTLFDTAFGVKSFFIFLLVITIICVVIPWVIIIKMEKEDPNSSKVYHLTVIWITHFIATGCVFFLLAAIHAVIVTPLEN